MLFVTGMLRSGTTLLEKLLACHPRVSILSQPFPYLFFDAKRDFLRARGRDDVRYPLGDLFLEDYRPDDFCRFLDHYSLPPGQLLASFESMRTYSGQSTRFSSDQLTAAIAGRPPLPFAETIAHLYRALSPRPDAAWFGGKETMCEEFLPCFLDRGGACALILRDPRDILASLNHGRGERFGGTTKPTLFNLRQWRKSVAFALHLRQRGNFTWLRYEDLVARPIDTLATLAERLRIDPFTDDLLAGGLRTTAGQPWTANSSHFTSSRIESSSVGAYRTLVDPAVVAFTEAVCHAELRYLGYATSLDPHHLTDVIGSFRDPYGSPREDLQTFFAQPERIEEELARVEALHDPRSSRYFLFDTVQRELRESTLPPPPAMP